ncbi:TolC family protein [Jejuia pallidilutea]|uniref:Outer membrane protein TolC putative n=1 Tax=Jejuia pallidilutea TaxID=504487 RepID=A0A098LVR0_9FLAO|nr:TolC family protein [Jejuia pallidilutea]GAL91026.1 outer membrane protein TolC putative [Jejuia pallidilutea]
MIKYSKIKQIVLCVCVLISSSQLEAQQQDSLITTHQTITLNDILKLASKNSLDVFKAKRKYGVNYWQFRSFKSSLLPKIDFETRPFTYNRALIERYDSELNIDVFRQQQTINSFANLSLSQNIAATGTRLFINSSFNRLENFGNFQTESYNATPVRIGLSQPIMAFNPFKWQQKTAPIEFQKAKQDFLYELQTINLKSVDLFFKWALASKKVEIAQENKISAEKLFNIGKKRYDLIAIERDELLNLELDVYNANTNLTQNLQTLQKTEAELKLFLRDKLPQKAVPELPELITNLSIDLNKAIALAYENNPDILDLKLRKIEALRDLDKAIKDNRFDLSLNASYGLNQQANTFVDAYGRFLDQQMVSIQLNVPVLDWGERKGKIKTAKMNKDVVDIELQQNEDSYKQDVTLNVLDFNLQKELVDGALRTRDIAKESYTLTEKRFLSGSVDFLSLTASRKAWQQANENYIRALESYWKIYYKVQQLTLYNFIKDTPLIQDFETILEN